MNGEFDSAVGMARRLLDKAVGMERDRCRSMGIVCSAQSMAASILHVAASLGEDEYQFGLSNYSQHDVSGGEKIP